MVFKAAIQLSAQRYWLKIGQNQYSLFRTNFETKKNLSKIPKNKFREQTRVNYEKGDWCCQHFEKADRERAPLSSVSGCGLGEGCVL